MGKFYYIGISLFAKGQSCQDSQVEILVSFFVWKMYIFIFNTICLYFVDRNIYLLLHRCNNNHSFLYLFLSIKFCVQDIFSIVNTIRLYFVSLLFVFLSMTHVVGRAMRHQVSEFIGVIFTSFLSERLLLSKIHFWFPLEICQVWYFHANKISL